MSEHTVGMVSGERPDSEFARVLADIMTKHANGGFTLNEWKLFAKRQNPFQLPIFTFQDWQELYRDCFGIVLPEFPLPANQPDFNWLVVVAQGITPQKAYDACLKGFPCWKDTNKSLDEEVFWEARTAAKNHYAVWLRSRIEADEELKNLSAEMLDQQKIPGNGLRERLLLELMYFRKTGKHLDIKNVSLCAGSRSRDGFAFRVFWDPGYGKMYVCLRSVQDGGGDLRARQVVS